MSAHPADIGFERAVREILREHGITPKDAGYRGEIAKLFENRSYRMKYQRANGLTIDGLCEVLWERGLYVTRPSCREVFDMLTDVLRPLVTRDSSLSRSVEAAEVHAIEVRRKTRLRLYVCAECGQKLRASTDSLVIEHVHVDPDTMAESRVPFVRVTPVLNASTPF